VEEIRDIERVYALASRHGHDQVNFEKLEKHETGESKVEYFFHALEIFILVLSGGN
jgi:hypothetical protein